LLVLGRLLVREVVTEQIAITLLGVLAVLTGVLHVTGGFERERTKRRLAPLTGILLGAFEVVLGILLLTSHANLSRSVYLVATAWAFAGAAMLVGDALRMRAQARSRRSESR
jgi:uncharacterized membrane protein HdeD (DUF308 family)